MGLPIRRATPQRPPTRSRSRIVPAPPYNSGGIAPELTVGVQKRRPTRATPDVSFGSGVIASVSPQVVAAPRYNSGGIQARITAGVRRRNLVRVPERQQAPAFNSGSLVPRVTRGISRRLREVMRARLLAAPQATAPSAGTAPVLSRGIRRTPLAALRGRRVVPPPINAGTTPLVSAGVRRRFVPQLRGRRVVPPTPNVVPVVGSISQGIRRRPLPALRPRLAAPAYNSGGILPTIIRGIKRLAAKNAASRPRQGIPYNSGGLRPLLSQGIRRKNLSRPASRRVIPAPFQPPGVRPVVSIARHQPRYYRRSLPRMFRPSVNTTILRDIRLILGPPRSSWSTNRPFSGWRIDRPRRGWDADQPTEEI